MHDGRWAAIARSGTWSEAKTLVLEKIVTMCPGVLPITNVIQFSVYKLLIWTQIKVGALYSLAIMAKHKASWQQMDV